MATTYELIASTTLGSNAASVTFGSGGTIPQTYTDLLIVASSRGATTGIGIRFNGDTGSNYSWRRLNGNGTLAASDSNTTYGGAYNTFVYTMQSQTSYTASTFGSTEIYIPNYASSNNKSVSTSSCAENNATQTIQGATAGLWSNTAAITSATLVCDGGDFVTGSSFYLYGIKKA
jgi:hypothetical protein